MFLTSPPSSPQGMVCLSRGLLRLCGLEEGSSRPSHRAESMLGVLCGPARLVQAAKACTAENSSACRIPPRMLPSRRSRSEPEHTVPAWKPQGSKECGPFPWKARHQGIPSSIIGLWQFQVNLRREDSTPGKPLYLFPSHASEASGPSPRACRENPTSYSDETGALGRARLNFKSRL